ncbi:phage tail assembly chaperone [Paenochrobactrum sp. BZR 588]|uniref:phage tail assembly chaperone n=1 Tax=unclassified Paenochrobactrum TaxID=2639760 RepID=UPI0038552538
MGKRGARGSSNVADGSPWRDWQKSAYGVLRWTPETFWRSTLSEFIAAIEGFTEARGGKKSTEHPTDDQLDDLLAKYG